MIKINFSEANPDFVNGDFKWYYDKHFMRYIENEQADNLPKLNGLGCFIIKNNDIEDYILIDDKQNVLAAYPYTLEGAGQMEAMINIIKISKHFDDYEKSNINTSMIMKNLTFNEFCHKHCDGLYDPRLPENVQCMGYVELKKMVVGKIKPASLKEIKRWEESPTRDELLSTPDIKYLRFLHPLLRPYIINNWKIIKNLKVL